MTLDYIACSAELRVCEYQAMYGKSCESCAKVQSKSECFRYQDTRKFFIPNKKADRNRIMVIQVEREKNHLNTIIAMAGSNAMTIQFTY